MYAGASGLLAAHSAICAMRGVLPAPPGLSSGSNAHDVVLTPQAAQIASVSGVVTAASSGAAVAGALVRIGSATAITGADGSFTLQNLQIGGKTVITSAPHFDQRSQSVSLIAGANTHDIVLTEYSTDPVRWPQCLIRLQSQVPTSSR